MILGVGIFFLFSALINKALTNRFLFFNDPGKQFAIKTSDDKIKQLSSTIPLMNTTEEKINALKNTLDQLKNDHDERLKTDNVQEQKPSSFNT